MSTAPSLRVERGLLRAGVTHLACVDEVGRGALSGPVTIGIVVIGAATRTAPQGVRDSKLLSPDVRERLVPRIRRWALAYAVGHASPDEIDAHGIIAALRLAGHRALAQLPVAPDAVLLDGNHDYLTPPAQRRLFDGLHGLDGLGGLDGADGLDGLDGLDGVGAGDGIVPGSPSWPRVTTRIKADLTCAGVAAASVLAKTARDAIMRELHLEHPVYDWADNKGYSAPAHLEALAAHGPSAYHRRSWNLPGVAGRHLEGWPGAAVDQPVEPRH